MAMADDATAARIPLGQMLLARGAVSAGQLDAALDVQRDSPARIGEILASRGWVSRRDITEALAEQAGLAPHDSPDVTGAVRTAPAELEILLRHRLLPLGEGLGYATADAPTGRLGLAALGLQPEAVRLVLAEPDALDAALLHRYGPALAERASTRPPLALSARAPVPWRQRTGLAALIAAAVAAEIVLPEWRGAGLFVFLVLLNAMNAVVRIAVLGAALGAGARSAAAPPPGIVALSDRRPLPRISLLVPLLREPEVLPVLLRALDALDWPRELLDVIVILETGDTATMAEIDRLGLPPWARVLVLPPGGPRTKPRALNLALDFARGDVIGLYDAEDRPEPDQLRRVAAILRDSPADVACVQCHLSYYNTRENWLTRCFTLEYAMWFDVLIAGFDRLRLPIPLGGTSVFFRRAALERVGGWDAHNVTEDADLGMRLARMGYRCVVAESTTHEEANSRLGPWVRQRSRWLKGYMTTWLVHMRSPLRLWRDLGTRGFLAFQALFLGAAVAYLGLPVFWAVWGAALLGHGPGWLIASPLWLIVVLGVVQLSGWLAMLAAALIATARRRQWWLQPWVPTLAVYWPLGALAAYLALAELVVAPAHWRKTRHGVGRLAAAERAEALSMREDSAKAARRAAS